MPFGAPSRLASNPAIARSTASASSAAASESSGARYRIASDGALADVEMVHSEFGVSSAKSTSAPAADAAQDRKSVVEGKSVSVRVDLGGRRIIKKTKIKSKYVNTNQKHI